MATEYTSAIKDGITFEQFAWRCARAFGALISMRDDPMDAPIPEKIEPSDYHKNAIESAKKRIAEIQKMTADEAGNAAIKEYESDYKSYEKELKDSADLERKYLDMLKNVDAWEPPTGEHVEYKHFMQKQIRESIEFDCGTDYLTQPEPVTGSFWKQHNIEKLKKDITYHEKKHKKEVERTNSRNNWINALRESLK